MATVFPKKKEHDFAAAAAEADRLYEQNRQDTLQKTKEQEAKVVQTLSDFGAGKTQDFKTVSSLPNEIQSYRMNLQRLQDYGYDLGDTSGLNASLVQAETGVKDWLSGFKDEQDYNNRYYYLSKYKDATVKDLDNSVRGLNQQLGMLQSKPKQSTSAPDISAMGAGVHGEARQRANTTAAKPDPKRAALQQEIDWIKNNRQYFYTDDELDSTLTKLDAQLADARKKMGDVAGSTDAAKGSRMRARAKSIESQIATLSREKDDRATARMYDSFDDKTKEQFDNYVTWNKIVQSEQLKGKKWSANTYVWEKGMNGLPDRYRIDGTKTYVTDKDELEYAKAQTGIQDFHKTLRKMGYSSDEIKSILDRAKKQHNTKTAQAKQKKAAEFAENHEFLASLASVPLELVSGVGYLDQLGQYVTGGTDALTGRRRYVDPNRGASQIGMTASTYRDVVAGELSEHGTIGQVGSFLYQTGMSIADFLTPVGAAGLVGKIGKGTETAMKVAGGITKMTTPLLGGAAASQTLQDARARGASDSQAIALATMSGIAETLFESVSLEKLKMFQSTMGEAEQYSIRELAADVAKQSFTEGSEEAATTLANTVADLLIMSDKNSINNAVMQLMSQGYTREDATRMAWKDWWGQLGLDTLGGALSGFAISTAGGVGSRISNAKLGSMVFDSADDQQTGMMSAISYVEAALSDKYTSPDSTARKIATHIAENYKGTDFQTKLPRSEMGRLVRAFVTEQREKSLNEVRQPKSVQQQVAEENQTRLVFTQDESGVVTATRLSPVAEQMMASGFTAKDAVRTAPVVERIAAGLPITEKQFDALDLRDAALADTISKMSGQTIDVTVSSLSELKESYRAAIKAQADKVEALNQEQGRIAEERQRLMDAQADFVESIQTEAQRLEEGARAQIEEINNAPSQATPEADTITLDNGNTMTRDEFVQSFRQGVVGSEAQVSDEEIGQMFDRVKASAASNGGVVKVSDLAAAMQSAPAQTSDMAEAPVKDAPAQDETAEPAESAEPVEQEAEAPAKPKTKAQERAEIEKGLEAEGATKVADGVYFVESSDPDAPKKLTLAQEWSSSVAALYLRPLGITAVVWDQDACSGSNAFIVDNTGVMRLNPARLTDRSTIMRAIGHEITHPATNDDKSKGKKGRNDKADDILRSVVELYHQGALRGELAQQVEQFIAPAGQKGRPNLVEAVVARYKTYYTVRAMEAERAAAEAENDAQRASLLNTAQRMRSEAEKVDDHYARQEIASDWIGFIFENPRMMERLAGVRPNTVDRVFRAVRKMRGVNFMTVLNGQQRKAAEESLDMLMDDVNKAIRNSKLKAFRPKDTEAPKRKAKATGAKAETRETKSSGRGQSSAQKALRRLSKNARMSLTEDAVDDTIKNTETTQKEETANGRTEQRPDHRRRQDAGRAGEGQPSRRENDRSTARARSDRRGDLPVHDGDLTPKVRALATEKGTPNLGLRTAEYGDFSTALDAGRSSNRNGAMVDPQSVESLTESGAKTFLSEDGLAGVAVESDGNIVGVFKHSDLRVRLVGYDLLLTAIANGGNHLDCYVLQPDVSLANLGDLYMQLGFEPVAFLQFNREYADPNWDYEQFGEPDVVMWIHNGDSVETVAERMGDYPDIYTPEYIRENCKEFTDYDEAKAYQKEQLNKRTAQTSEEAGAVSVSEEARYSLRAFPDGTRFVRVDRYQDELNGLTGKDLAQAVLKLLKSNFVGKVIGLDNQAFFNRGSAHEYVYPAKRLSRDLYDAKMSAGAEIDNLLDAGTNFRTTPDGADGHTHDNAVGDFQIYDTIFQVGNEFYRGQVNVMPVAKGLLLKDITQIKNITKDIIRIYGQNPTSEFLRDVSMPTVAQDDAAVKSEDDGRHSVSGFEVYNHRAIVGEETLAQWFNDYAASNPNYAQAYMTYMSPSDYLNLTTGDPLSRSRITQEAEGLDVDRVVDASKQQPIQLRISAETGEVLGHEGRHRMVALRRAGVTRIPVMLFDSGNKYSKTPLDTLTLHGQFNRTADATVTDVQPFSRGNEEAIRERFVNQTSMERIGEKYGNPQVRFYIDQSFAMDIDEWNADGQTAHTVFNLGTTGDTLMALGVREGDIRMDSDKIKDIMAKHPEMTLDEIKALPKVLNDPVLVLKSRNAWRNQQGQRSHPNTRLILFGTKKAKNGLPIMVALDIKPANTSGKINFDLAGMQAVVSAYTKDNPDTNADFLRRSYVLYADKRAATVLRPVGFQLPTNLPRSGYMGSVTHKGPKVKLDGMPFTDVFREAPEQRFSIDPSIFQTPEFRSYYNDLLESRGLTQQAVAKQRAKPPKPKVSQVATHTLSKSNILNAAERLMDGMTDDDFTYTPETEIESMNRAKEALDADFEGEYDRLRANGIQTNSDVDMSMGILSELIAHARKTNDYTEAIDFMQDIRSGATQAGQMIQAFAKYNRTPEGVLFNAHEALAQSDLSKDDRDALLNQIGDFVQTLKAIERGEEGDRADLIDLIVEQAKMRNTHVSRWTMRDLGEQKIEYLYDAALNQLDQIAKDYVKPSAGKQIATYQTIAHLFNVRTAGRNVISNVSFNPFAAIANDLAIIPDYITGLFTGRRNVGMDWWLLTPGRGKAKHAAGRTAAVELALDIDPRPNRRDKYGTARRTWKMTGNAAARAGSRIEKAMGYELNWTDERHKGAVRAEIERSLRGLVGKGFITEEMAAEWAEKEALYRAFQDDTYPGMVLAGLKRLGNTLGVGKSGEYLLSGNRGELHDFGVGDLLVKYTQVPGALISRAVEFSPLGYLKALHRLIQMPNVNKAYRKAANRLEDLEARQQHEPDNQALMQKVFAAKDTAAKANMEAATAQREFALAMGRATTGTGLIQLFVMAAASGLLRRADDEEDKNVKAMLNDAGATGTQFNPDALWRLIKTGKADWQYGDHLWSVEFLEPLNALMTIGFKINAEIKEDQTIWEKLNTVLRHGTVEGIWDTVGELSVLQTIGTIKQSLEYADQDQDITKPELVAIDLARSSLTGFVPSPVRQAAQAFDTVQRDTYTSKDPLQMTLDQMRNSIPGVRNKLPAKLDSYGNPRELEPKVLNVLNAFAIPGSVRTYRMSDEAKVLDEVSKQTGKTSFYPTKNAPYKDTFSIDGKEAEFKLTPEEREQYKQTSGQYLYALHKNMMADSFFTTATPEDQAEMLSMAKSMATYKARQELAKNRDAGEYTDSTQERNNGALDVNYTVASWWRVKDVTKNLEGEDLDGDGEADSGSKKKEALQNVQALNLTDDQKVYWFHGTNYDGKNKDKIENAAAQGISATKYIDAQLKLADAHGEDANGDGKTDSGTLLADKIRIIQSLPLTAAQKKWLFLLENSTSTKKADSTAWTDTSN